MLQIAENPRVRTAPTTHVLDAVRSNGAHKRNGFQTFGHLALSICMICATRYAAFADAPNFWRQRLSTRAGQADSGQPQPCE